MNAWHLFFALMLVISSCHTEHNYSERRQGLTILHLIGAPYERGLFHGRMMKEQIHDVIYRWKAELPCPLEQYPEQIINSYLHVADSLAPDLVLEIRGMADGSGIEFGEMFAFQIGEELENINTESREHCTSISTNKPFNNQVMVAQNMDAPPFLHGYPLLLHITEDGRETFVFTSPGLIGLDGMNSNGVAITCNSMSMLKNDLHGLPVAFIVRKCLQHDSFRSASDFILNADHSTPQAYTVGGRDSSACFECSPAGCFPFFAFREQGITLHTNFSVANRDFNYTFKAVLAAYGKTTDDPYYCPRYFRAYDMVVEKGYRLEPADIMDILSTRSPDDEPISNPNTYGSLVMVLGERPYLLIAPGRPDTTEYLQIGFKR